jgi:hypothetical protein
VRVEGVRVGDPEEVARHVADEQAAAVRNLG